MGKGDDGGRNRDGDKDGPKAAGSKSTTGGDAGLEALFKLADRDGKLSKGELRGIVGAGDADGDGLLSLKELIDLR